MPSFAKTEKARTISLSVTSAAPSAIESPWFWRSSFNESNPSSRSFEKYASISALLKMTEAENLKEVFYLIEKNPNMQNIFEEYLDNLSEGLANIINIYDPEMLVIGGSLSEYGDKFLYKLKSKLISKVYNKYTYDFNLKSASLKNEAGIIGAGLLYKYMN